MFQPDYPVFVLSLPGDERRRQPLLSTLEEFEISHELFFGIDGRNGLPPDCEHLVDRRLATIRNRRVLTDGEFACALSHQAIYAEIARRNLPGAVVLEDDAVLSSEFPRLLREGGFQKADVVLLGHHGTLVRRASPREIVAGVKGYGVAAPPYGAYAYSVSADAARRIHRASLPISKNADWPCDISRLDTVALMPRLVTPDRTFSHLQTERGAVIGTARRPGLELLRRLFIYDDWSRLIGRMRGVKLD